MNRFATLLAATGTTAALFLAISPAAAQTGRDAFTGPRVEVTTGYDVTKLDNQPAGAPDSVGQARIGIAAGYDMPISDNWRLGAELGAGWTLGDGRNYNIGATQYQIDQGRDLDASVRLGYVLGDRTMIYAKAGYANSRYTARVGAAKASTNEDGFRAGVGVEHMVGKNVYAKGEYRYTSYGHGVDRHQLLAGVGYRF